MTIMVIALKLPATASIFINYILVNLLQLFSLIYVKMDMELFPKSFLSSSIKRLMKILFVKKCSEMGLWSGLKIISQTCPPH